MVLVRSCVALVGSFVVGACTMPNPAFDPHRDEADGASEDEIGDGDGDPGEGGSGSGEEGDGDGDGEPEPRCGDGAVDVGEECDEGEANHDLGECTSACELAICGDGFVQPALDEACDLGPANGSGGPCRADCQLNVCGDGYLGPGEACEIDQPSCTQECTLPTCGNGMLDEAERCDDGNDNNNDGCTNVCTAAACGDTFVQGGEACDDGNASNDDACLTTCELAKCGDGFILEGEEECDSDNLAGMSCLDFDMLFGELGCTNCEFDLSECAVCVPLGGACESTADCCDGGLVTICAGFACVSLL